jgi:GTP pyrophosphokinase
VNGVVSSRKRRAALVVDPPIDAPAELLADLCEVIRTARPDADLDLIQRAYEVSAAWHHGLVRLSGDPYITHPVAVATILVGLGADDQALCAALLFSAVKYTTYPLGELSRDFGADIAALVAEINELDQIRYGTRRALARITSIIQTADSRVLLVKLADRLHNMRTLEFLPQDRQLRKARESLELFVPTAARLSLRTIESELETLASATLLRHQYSGSASGRLLTAVTALLPAPVQTRWREEWIGELHTLPTRCARARFAVHTVLGVPRLAVTLRRPSPAGRPGR